MALAELQASTTMRGLGDTPLQDAHEMRRISINPANETDTQNVGSLTPTELEEPLGQSLRPVDGGYAAWRVLIAAFLLDAFLWGEYLMRIIIAHEILLC